MDEAQAIAALEVILGPAFTLLTDAQIALALSRAQVVDAAGVEPGGDGYVPTFDQWIAAAEAADILGIVALGQSGSIVKWSSEGSSFERTSADFFTMAARLRDKSDQGSGVGIGIVSIDQGEELGGWPRSAGEGGGYLTWDRDVPVWFGWRSPDV